MGMVLDLALEFYSIVAKRLKLEVSHKQLVKAIEKQIW